MGNTLLELEIVEDVDELRISARDYYCTYCLYRSDCYFTRSACIRGMKDALAQLDKEFDD